jgi:hypothetical protein
MGQSGCTIAKFDTNKLHSTENTSEPTVLDEDLASSQWGQRTADEAGKMIEEHLREKNLNFDENPSIKVEEIPFEEIWTEINTQIFRVLAGENFLKESFLIRGTKVIQLGSALGGQGITSLAVADIDRDSYVELYYAYSFGADTPKSRLGVYAPAIDEGKVFEANFSYLGHLNVFSEDRIRVGVQIIEENQARKAIRYLDMIGNLGFEMNGDEVNLFIDLSPGLGDDVIKKILIDPTKTPISSFETKQGKDYHSDWVKLSDPHYGIQFAVPCFWHVDMPEKNYRGLSYIIRNYSYEYSARFPRNDKDFWEGGGIKIDMAFPQKAYRSISMEDYVENSYLHAEVDDFELVSTEEIEVNGQNALLVTTKSVFGIGHFYLFDLNENVFLIFSLSPGAIENPDVQTILHSLAIDPDTPVRMPENPPGYPLEEVISDCKGATELEVLMIGPKSLSWGSGKSLTVQFALMNNSSETLYVLDWFTPFEGIAGDIFQVIYNGQPLQYQGILAMRGDPTPESYLLIKAGGALTGAVNLSSVYDFSRPGSYSIAYKSPRISDVAVSVDDLATTISELGPVYIPSNEIIVEIEMEE